MAALDASPQRRADILAALRGGTVPQQGLALLAVGLDRFGPTFDEELAHVASGAGVFKAIRGEYGSGKTFFSRWLAERAKGRGMAASEVQISETETPLHRYQTVYRRLVERLATQAQPVAALRSIVDSWFFTLEDDVLSSGEVDEADVEALARATDELMERRLGRISETAPSFSACLRAYHRASIAGDHASAQGLLAWLGGQPHVAAAIKRPAGIKGELDHDAALSFLEGLLVVLRDAGHPGLLVVLDEVETLQRVRSDARDRGLNSLRQLIDEVQSGRFPGLYLVITGTPAFYDGPQGATRLPPLDQRLRVRFPDDARFDNPRAVQVRLQGFDQASLVTVGARVRDLFAGGAADPERVHRLCDDAYLAELAVAVAGQLGGNVGISPRLYLRKLVEEVLDPIDLHPDFDPRLHHHLTVSDGELTSVERQARHAATVDDIELTVGDE